MPIFNERFVHKQFFQVRYGMLDRVFEREERQAGPVRCGPRIIDYLKLLPRYTPANTNP